MKILPISNSYAKQYSGFQVQMANKEAELELYGEIVETQPCDWWTDEPIAGNWIVQGEVLDELKNLQSAGVKKLLVRINSIGGDAGVSITIHNRLRELQRDGMEVTCVVDGVAMSGGSLIMCACDTVRINPASLVMIHKCWSFFFGGYNADDLRQMADNCDAYDRAQASIYCRKTGLSSTKVLHMMGETTYMTGKDAVEQGFADELIEDAEPVSLAASAALGTVTVNGRTVRVEKKVARNIEKTLSCTEDGEQSSEIEDEVAEGDGQPQAADGELSGDGDQNQVSTGEEPEDIENQNMPAGTGEEGGNQTMATNLNELRTENPELAAQVEADVRAGLTADTNAAVEAERNRLREIDAISALYGDEAVQAAKYGDHPMTAQELAYAQAQAAAQQGTAFAAAMQDDAAQANEVPAAAAKTDDGSEVDVEAAAKADYAKYKERKEGKK